MADLTAVNRSWILEGLTESDLAALAGIAHDVEMKVGQCMFARGDLAVTLFIAKEGAVTLTHGLRVFENVVQTAAEELGSREPFCWSALVEPYNCLYSAYCVEEGSAIAFPREALETLMASEPTLAAHFARMASRLVARRLRALQDLWFEEIEQNMARIEHWSRRKTNEKFKTAMRVASQ